MAPTELPCIFYNCTIVFLLPRSGTWLYMYEIQISFSPSAGKWSIPTTTGPGPPPCSYFSFTAINDHQAVLFGGRQSDGRVSDCYLINFVSMVSPGVFSFMEDYI